jgi:nitrite reductase (cytochrome c-552)
MQIQDNTFQAQRLAGVKIAEAHDAIAEAANTSGVNEAKLHEAREFNRKAQFYWDYVAAENSMGFHAPDQILNTLAQAQQYANDALIAAYQASGRLR